MRFNFKLLQITVELKISASQENANFKNLQLFVQFEIKILIRPLVRNHFLQFLSAAKSRNSKTFAHNYMTISSLVLESFFATFHNHICSSCTIQCTIYVDYLSVNDDQPIPLYCHGVVNHHITAHTCMLQVCIINKPVLRLPLVRNLNKTFIP